MAKDLTQLEMFSLGEEKEKKKEHLPVERNFVVSRNVLIYAILGILLLLVAVYIAGVEKGRRWKVDEIYKEYIQGVAEKSGRGK